MRRSSKRGLGLPLCSATILALWGVAAPARAMPSHFRKGPYVQDVTPSAVTVRFETTSPTAATVEVRPVGSDADASAPEGPPKVVLDAAASFHVVAVEGLAPHRRYHYSVNA